MKQRGALHDGLKGWHPTPVDSNKGGFSFWDLKGTCPGPVDLGKSKLADTPVTPSHGFCWEALNTLLLSVVEWLKSNHLTAKV